MRTRSEKPNASRSHAAAVMTSGYANSGITIPGGIERLLSILPPSINLPQRRHRDSPSSSWNRHLARERYLSDSVVVSSQSGIVGWYSWRLGETVYAKILPSC